MICCATLGIALGCASEGDPPAADGETTAAASSGGRSTGPSSGPSSGPSMDGSSGSQGTGPTSASTTSGDDPSAGSDDAASETGAADQGGGSTGDPAAQCEVELDASDCTAPGYDGPGECDPYQQDCPEGLKCLPYDPNEAGAWGSTRCAPIVEDAAGVGEPCTMTAGSAAGGEDTCGLGLVCWNLAGNTGTCAEMCGCGVDSPTCEGDGLSCARINAGSVAVCSDACVPSELDACDAPQVCTITAGGIFHCIPASGQAGEGEPCASLSACQAGLFCAGSALCEGDAPCCLPFCDLDDPGVCETECIPFFTERAPHECYDTLGACPAV